MSVVSICLDVLMSSNLEEKCRLCSKLRDEWVAGDLEIVTPDERDVPDYPERPSCMIRDDADAKSTPKVSATVSMLHGICHAESYAIDLFVDLLARFGREHSDTLPRDFFDDFVEVCFQEACHFASWRDRLGALACDYGSLPVHDGLWRAAYETRNDLLERLAIINMVHEARGLDTYPLSRKKLVNARDDDSVRILDHNYAEEVTHVRKGVTWFSRVCEQRGLVPKATFQEIVGRYMKLPLKGQFNHEARSEAGFDSSWYQELAKV